MKEFTYIVKDPLGVHARPAGFIARIAKKYEGTEVLIQTAAGAARAVQLIKIMSLGIKKDDKVTVSAEGEQEEEVLEELRAYFEKNL